METFWSSMESLYAFFPLSLGCFQLKASLESFHFEIDVIIPKIGESICFRI